MALTEFECRFASEMPFVGMYAAWDSDKEKRVQRMVVGKLTCTPEMIFAKLGTPSGVPVLWGHGPILGLSPAVGRVLSMGYGNKEILGTIGVRDEDLRQYMAGGVDALNDGVNRGLSVGLRAREPSFLRLKTFDGTREKPDRLSFGMADIIEVSLTPNPQIADAGILARLGGEDAPAPTEEEVENE